MNTDSPETRIAILARMTRQARMTKQAPDQRLGRTQVMKLLYFLQELKGIPLGYDFRLFNYGPFDSEVLSDLSLACSSNAVVEETLLFKRSYGYDIKPGLKADELDHSLESEIPKVASAVDEVVGEFGHLSAGELELRSTIFFADRELNQAGKTTTDRDLATTVHKIKPHFSVPAILERMHEMAAKGLLESLSGGRP
jgi:uncharacterized protein YwgA